MFACRLVNPDKPATPIAIGQVIHNAKDWSAHDVALNERWITRIISPSGAGVDVIDSVSARRAGTTMALIKSQKAWDASTRLDCQVREGLFVGNAATEDMQACEEEHIVARTAWLNAMKESASYVPAP